MARVNPNDKRNEELTKPQNVKLERICQLMAILVAGGSIYYFFFRLLFL